VSEATLDALDDPTIALVRLSAVIAGGDEAQLREAVASAALVAPPVWIDELVVQSYLFSGFPRALNAAREWRRVAPSPAPAGDEVDDLAHSTAWRARGETTCAAVYGTMYEKLRANVRQLHPALDAAMVDEGYGKVLGRPGLDLPRRELCIVAACAITGQDRQLHSHLHGALNVGVSPRVLAAAVEALLPLLGNDRTKSVRLLLAKVVGK
jgi:4-carboxymuconolactone decarboxylase